MRKQLSLALLLVVLTVAVPAWAWPPTWGPEFEFTNKELSSINSSEGSEGREQEGKVAALFSDHIIKNVCPAIKCRAEQVDGKWGQEWRFSFDYRDRGIRKSTYFQVSWDPGCVEILMQPMTIEEMESAEEIVESSIFKAAKDFGLTSSYDSMNHVNMGIESTFDKDADLFLRTFVDQANHPEWDLGILGHDIHNGPPLSILSKEQRKQLGEIVEEFKSGRHKTIMALVTQINERVYTETLTWNEGGGKIHYQAVGLKSIHEKANTSFWGLLFPKLAKRPITKGRMEFRATWGQKNYAQFIRYAKFRLARIEYLRQQRKAGAPIEFRASQTKGFPVKEAMGLFETELDKMGVRREPFAILLHPVVRQYFNPYATCADVFLAN